MQVIYIETKLKFLGCLKIHNSNLNACGGMFLEIVFFSTYRVWVPVLPKKARSTLESLTRTGRFSHGKQRKMGNL